MVAAIIGTLLLAACIGLFCYTRLPNRRSTERMRQEARRRYAEDVDADQ